MAVMIFFITHIIMFGCMLVVYSQIVPLKGMQKIEGKRQVIAFHIKIRKTMKTKINAQAKHLKIQILEILLISILITVIMSGGMLWFKQGYDTNFYKIWLKDFLLSCSISVPAGYIIVPLVAMSTKRFKE
jgi:hypothetical protein